MRLTEPRITPIESEEFVKLRDRAGEILKFTMNKSKWEKLQQTFAERLKKLTSILGKNSVGNVGRTLARNIDLYLRATPYMVHSAFLSSLPERDREILILRNAWLCYSEYEWSWHALGGKRFLSDAEINRIMDGPDADGWDPFDAVLIRSVDELSTDTFIHDETWNSLAERYNTDQLMDLVFTVGCYNTTAMALNTFGVQLEDGLKRVIENIKFPKLK